MKRLFIKGTFILFLANLICFFLGYLKDALIVKNFGLSYLTDAWYITSHIPDVIFKFTFFGAIGASFIPIFSEYINKNEKEKAWKLATSVINLAFIVLSVVSILGIIFSKYLIFIFAPGFDKTTEEVANSLIKIIIISLPFIVVGGLLESIHRCFYRYFLTAIGQLFNVILFLIFFIFIFSSLGIFSLGFSLVCANIFSSLFLFTFAFIYYNNFYSFRIYFDENLKKVLRLAFPLVFADLIGKAITVTDGIFASFLSKGSIAALSLANRIINFPIIFLASALSGAIFPIFVNLTQQSKKDDFVEFFSFSIKLLILTVFPIFLILILFSKPIVKILFERGSFDEHATFLTAKLILILSPLLLIYSLRPILVNACYALKKNWWLFRYEFFAFFSNLILDAVLMKFFGIFGIAVATTIVGILVVSYLFLKLKWHLALNFGDFKFFLAKIMLSVGLMGISCIFLYRFFLKKGFI